MQKNVDDEIVQYVDEIVQSRDNLLQENTSLVKKCANQQLELKLVKDQLVEARNKFEEVKGILNEKNDKLEKTKKSKEIYEKLFSKHATSLNANHHRKKDIMENNATPKFLPLPLKLDNMDEIAIQENISLKKKSQNKMEKFADVTCTSCQKITTVFNQAQTSVSCIGSGCSTILHQPSKKSGKR